MKLITPLAFVRLDYGVVSGINAMVGERKMAIDKFMHTIKKINVAKLVWKGIREKNNAAIGIPTSK
jgi:isochorismate hydrolase